MLLKSMMLASVRPFYAAAGDPPAGGDDQGSQDTSGKGNEPPAGDDTGGDQGGADDTGGDQGGDDAAKIAADKAAADAAAAAAPADTWKDREIRRKHAQLQEAKRREAEKDAELETLRAIAERRNAPAGDGATSPPPPPPQPSLSRDDVQQEAQRIVAQQNFDNAANAADASGRTRYKADWDKATDTLKTLGGFDGPTMTAILATDDPAQVLYLLGSKPEEYQRIMELPEARRQNELVKLGIPVPVKKVAPSNAAAPVDSLQTRPRADGDSLDDKLDDDTWYARRARQKAARWEQKRQQQNRA